MFRGSTATTELWHTSIKRVEAHVSLHVSVAAMMALKLPTYPIALLMLGAGAY